LHVCSQGQKGSHDYQKHLLLKNESSLIPSLLLVSLILQIEYTNAQIPKCNFSKSEKLTHLNQGHDRRSTGNDKYGAAVNVIAIKTPKCDGE